MRRCLPALLALTACSEPSDLPPPPDDTASAADTACAGTPEVTWAGWADGFFGTWCRACHSETAEERYGAPEGLDFNTEDQVRAYAAAVRQVVLVDETMPVGGGVYEDELILLAAYLDCSL